MQIKLQELSNNSCTAKAKIVEQCLPIKMIVSYHTRVNTVLAKFENHWLYLKSYQRQRKKSKVTSKFCHRRCFSLLHMKSHSRFTGQIFVVQYICIHSRMISAYPDFTLRPVYFSYIFNQNPKTIATSLIFLQNKASFRKCSQDVYLPRFFSVIKGIKRRTSGKNRPRIKCHNYRKTKVLSILWFE